MKYPKLVPARLCKTPVKVNIESEELTEEGEAILTEEMSLMCNFQDGARRELTPMKKSVLISGKAYFDGDIAPGIPVISGGSLTVFGETRRIAEGRKARNPDGSVNYTELLLV